jgi:opacity protein-like surface antigen
MSKFLALVALAFVLVTGTAAAVVMYPQLAQADGNGGQGH